MALITTYCNAEAGFLQNQVNLVAAKLADGPAVIGESHGKARGRAVVGDLIDAGHVAELFLEFPDTSTVAEVIDTTPDAVAGPVKKSSQLAKAAHGTQTVGQYLRSVVTSHELTDTLTYYFVFIEHLSAYIGAVEAFGGTGGGGISLALLIDMAVQKGALVYLFDDLNGAPSIRRDAGDVQLKKRNQAMAANMPNADTRVKALVLNGDHHLLPAQCTGAAYTIQQLCGIAANRCFHLT